MNKLTFDKYAAAYYARYHRKNGADWENPECAKYTRLAIEYGFIFTTGLKLQTTRYAKDYGLNLEAAGFTVIGSNCCFTPQPGDVVVIQPCPGHLHGHMQIYDGQYWISDFRQNTFWPSDRNTSAWQVYKPSWTLYRFPNGSEQSPASIFGSKGQD